jgi:hypothetical protein
MRSFLEQAGAARETAAGIRRQTASLDVSAMGPTLKRSDRLDAHGAELEYRWLALTHQSEQPGSGWPAKLLFWRKGQSKWHLG